MISNLNSQLTEHDYNQARFHLCFYGLNEQISHELKKNRKHTVFEDAFSSKIHKRSFHSPARRDNVIVNGRKEEDQESAPNHENSDGIKRDFFLVIGAT